MLLDDYVVTYVQAQTSTVSWSFGREERVVNSGLYLFRDTVAVVLDFHHHAVPVAARAEDNLALSLNCVGGVVQDICPYLIKLAAVGVNLRHLERVLPMDRDIRFELASHD